ncbi:membrane progestin receptor beta-like [Mizuhopecten yessoensis]|uniref:Membrane progestin receptor beta n=1 Tax=Mizuhopecten yessoensis TaxID=6573 RepID=A0A210PHF6_MIZYE|nr:membrane progestin receptor beta-like [Mizuhopecten yessoensis]XP_021341592.1 membrane progestin receptor beta-like [Mizuhopecten yessoensis]OWF35912.1 Membrane progestin receptor beta [Mizuhopecten yessoensis]
MGPCILPGAVHWIVRCFRVQQTISADDTHLLFREPGVLTGFRPENKSWTHYLFSVCQVHNESVNIWSHLVGFGLIFCTLYRYLTIHISADSSHWFVIFAFGICCLIYTAISTFAHTFHSKSAFMHYTCFQFDYLGIGYFSLGFAIVTFYCSCHHHYFPMLEYYFLPINVLLSWIGFMCSSVAKLRYCRPYPFQRKLWNICSFGSQAASVFGLVIVRYWDCWLNDACTMSSLNHHTRVFMVSTISVFFFSSHLPERVFPGKFDIVGQGHQVFHVLCVVGTLLEFWAAYTDLETYSSKLKVEPDTSGIVTAMVTYGVLSLITLVILSPFTKRRIQQDMNVSSKCQ